MIPKQNRNILELADPILYKERRRNMTRILLDKMPNFPLPVSLEDIDRTFAEWTEKELAVTNGNGEQVPTIRLFANQRISEYRQTWDKLDRTGNIRMGFKMLLRDNPQKGESQGNYFNIPGNRRYPVFTVPATDEDGRQFYKAFTMHQPFCVDLTYTVIFTSSRFEQLNEFNTIVYDRFKALECYIFPNGHAMPMSLQNVSDSSEHSLDQRRFYSQDYEIKVKAYIIKDTDYEVVELPTKVRLTALGTTSRRKKAKAYVEEEEVDETCPLREPEDPIYEKMMTFHISGDTEFRLQTDFIVKTVTLNGQKPDIYINGEKICWELHCTWYEDDTIRVENNGGEITIQGFDASKIKNN